MQTVYVFQANKLWREIKKIEAEIIICEKFTWAQAKNKRRFLLGSTAFFTEVAAQRSKFGAMQKALQYKALRYQHPYVYYSLIDQIKQMVH